MPPYDVPYLPIALRGAGYCMHWSLKRPYDCVTCGTKFPDTCYVGIESSWVIHLAEQLVNKQASLMERVGHPRMNLDAIRRSRPVHWPTVSVAKRGHPWINCARAERSVGKITSVRDRGRLFRVALSFFFDICQIRKHIGTKMYYLLLHWLFALHSTKLW